METENKYSYEDMMINLDEVMDMIEDALEKHKGLSLCRFGHGEIAYIGRDIFPEWRGWFEYHSIYAGATASDTILQKELLEALKDSDIVGLHASWGYEWEDREAAKLTSTLLKYFEIKPNKVCAAFISHEMINSDRFWETLRNHKVALIGRRAEEALDVFREKGINATYAGSLEGYFEVEKVSNDLIQNDDWEIVLLAAGIPATIMAPKLARQTNKVVIDFGHALDMVIDGKSFDYNKLVKTWKEVQNKRMLVSIIMAVYNGQKFIEESINSALAQTYKNIQIIIVNDGSTDCTKQILDGIDDKRVEVIHLEKNKGAANALNIGIMKAKGSWIAILDADDNYYPQKIEEQVKYVLAHPELVGVGTLINCIAGGPDISQGHLDGYARYKNSYVSKKDIKDNIYWGCPLTHSSMMFNKDVFWQVGGYDTELKIAYDYDLWLKLLDKGDIVNIPEVLLDYRVYKQSLSNKNAYATVNEIQIVSSRGIYRLFSKGGERQPKVAVIGSLKALKNYKDIIAPASDLIVEAITYRDWRNKVFAAIKNINYGKLDAMIVLENKRNENIIAKYASKYLKANINLFYIYNILD